MKLQIVISVETKELWHIEADSIEEAAAKLFEHRLSYFPSTVDDVQYEITTVMDENGEEQPIPATVERIVYY